MVELFELIASKPLEFLAGLGISTTTIYTLFRALKGLFSLITKKSQKAKEILTQENIANVVVSKIQCAEDFMDKLANLVVSKLTQSELIIALKKVLEDIEKMETCPVELKAYISTVLSNSGSEELLLLYKETKNQLIEQSKKAVEEAVQNGEEKLQESKEKLETVQTEVVVEVPVAVEEKKMKKKKQESEGDVTYA